MLILKSASPRRKQVFENLKLQFQVEPSHIDENTRDKEIPLDYLRRVTIAKLDTEKSNLENVYVSSDTIVVLDNRILAKPKDFAEGMKILSFLSGKIHSVYSGLAIWKAGQVFYDFDETKVEFKVLGELEIRNYLEEAKPYDKAGAYGIQDVGTPVSSYIGSYTNVLGFPIRKFYQFFRVWEEFLS